MKDARTYDPLLNSALNAEAVASEAAFGPWGALMMTIKKL